LPRKSVKDGKREKVVQHALRGRCSTNLPALKQLYRKGNDHQKQKTKTLAFCCVTTLAATFEEVDNIIEEIT
jgi:hypothetical protein